MEIQQTASSKKLSKWKTTIMSTFLISSKQHKSSSSTISSNSNIDIPKEFLCLISNRLMTQPVIVSSGHTFDLSSIQLCQNLQSTPTLPDGSVPDFSALIPNLALRSAIQNFCTTHSIPFPFPSTNDHLHTEKLLPTTATKEEQIVAKLRSGEEVQETLESLRAVTRSSEGSRVLLCTPRILSTLKCFIVSRCVGVQANAVATLVNLSLEKVNKVKILRSGLVPFVIDVAKCGFPEAQEYACSVLFSLALDDANKTAIGVLGALGPLVHALRSPAKMDAAWALYHLSFVQSNRTKLVKMGAVQSLLTFVKDPELGYPISLILGNMAACIEGRTAMLDAGAVGVILSMLGADKNGVESTVSGSAMESCMTVLHELSHGGIRFKILAKEAGSLEILRKLEGFSNSDRVKEKARRVMETVMDKWEEIEEDVDWEELIDSGFANGTGSGKCGYSPSQS